MPRSTKNATSILLTTFVCVAAITLLGKAGGQTIIVEEDQTLTQDTEFTAVQVGNNATWTIDTGVTLTATDFWVIRGITFPFTGAGNIVNNGTIETGGFDGQFSAPLDSFVNNGLIRASGASRVAMGGFGFWSDAAFTNNGLIEGGAGSEIEFGFVSQISGVSAVNTAGGLIRTDSSGLEYR